MDVSQKGKGHEKLHEQQPAQQIPVFPDGMPLPAPSKQPAQFPHPHPSAHPSLPRPGAVCSSSHIEAEQRHIAILHDIFLALAAHKPLFPAGGHASCGHQVFKGNNLRTDESPLKVRMNLSSGLGSLCPAANRPGPALIRPRRQEGDQPQQVIALGDQPGQGRFSQCPVLQGTGPSLPLPSGRCPLRFWRR